MPVITFKYETPTNYTFVDAELASGKAVLSEVLPADATFHANYDADVNGVWGNGALAGTAVGGASVAGGKLNLKGGTKKYVDYAAAGNADSGIKGCIRFKVTPNYSGAPVGDTQFFVSMGQAEGSNNNFIAIHHDAVSGNLRMAFTSDVGGSFTTILGVWNPVAGTEYEFELNWDLTVGSATRRLFIDGVQFGSTPGASFTRTDTGIIRVGNSSAIAGGSSSFESKFEIDDLVIFDQPQHTSNFSGSSPITPPPQFTTGTVQTNTIIEAEDFNTFASTLSEPSGGTVLFGLEINGTLMWWNGAAWVASDGTASELNTAADIVANIGTIVSTPSSVKVFARLTAGDPLVTPSLDEVTIDYDFGGLPPGTSPVCAVHGFIRDFTGQPLSGVTVTVKAQWPNRYDEDLSGAIVLMGEPETAVTDADGYFEFDLIQGAKIRLVFETSSATIGEIDDLSLTVPQAQSVDVTTLLEPVQFPAN